MLWLVCMYREWNVSSERSRSEYNNTTSTYVVTTLLNDDITTWVRRKRVHVQLTLPESFFALCIVSEMQLAENDLLKLGLVCMIDHTRGWLRRSRSLCKYSVILRHKELINWWRCSLYTARSVFYECAGRTAASSEVAWSMAPFRVLRRCLLDVALRGTSRYVAVSCCSGELSLISLLTSEIGST